LYVVGKGSIIVEELIIIGLQLIIYGRAKIIYSAEDFILLFFDIINFLVVYSREVIYSYAGIIYSRANH